MRAKLISESLNKFEKKSDPLTSLGVGQKVLIENWLRKMRISDFVILDNFNINVMDDVNINFNNIIQLPPFIKFNYISGSFYCHHCSLVDLNGMPNRVWGTFNCSFNDLKNLDGCPQLIERHFICEFSKLMSLNGGPKEVKGDFYCNNNPVKFTRNDVKSICEVKGDIVI
jgi:hypothetical protein